ncbi:TetR/AcrR family transcriptional regulator [Bacillus sp. 1P06AnD]|uniref:TetR/AcrR family transcriptional regulator n=1 Tax=Bacillus sp. 1P06AnD TaxID=3132208 RepID=UPI0039A1C810
MKKQDPRVIKTKTGLKQALLKLIQQKNIEELSVKEICDEAKVTRPTFYLHFEDKEKLVEAVSDELLNHFRETVHASDAEEEMILSRTKPHPLFLRMFQHILDHTMLYKALLASNPNSPFGIKFKAEIGQFVSEGLYLREPDDSKLLAPRQVINIYTTAAYFEVILWWIREGYPISKDEMAFTLLNLSVYGPYAQSEK